MSKPGLYYKIYSETNGELSGNKPVIVFIHCIAVPSILFMKQIRYLQKKFDLILIDLPSHEKTELQFSDMENSFSSIAREILNILDFLHIQKAHFVGCSLGTFIVKHLLVYHNERVDKSILIGCVGKYQFFHHLILRFAYILINFISHEHFCYIIATALLPSRCSREAKRIALSCAKNLPKVEMKTYIKLFIKYDELSRSYIQRLNDFEIDTDRILYISGDKDKIFLATLKDELKFIKNFRLISHCGHIGNWDQPDRVNRLIDNFIINKK